MTDEEQHKKQLELASDYEAIFTTPEGERVLADIIRKGFLEAPASYPLPGKDGVTLICEGQRAEGRRELAHYIREMRDSLQRQDAGDSPLPDWSITGSIDPTTHTTEQ